MVDRITAACPHARVDLRFQDMGPPENYSIEVRRGTVERTNGQPIAPYTLPFTPGPNDLVLMHSGHDVVTGVFCR